MLSGEKRLAAWLSSFIYCTVAVFSNCCMYTMLHKASVVPIAPTSDKRHHSGVPLATVYFHQTEGLCT